MPPARNIAFINWSPQRVNESVFNNKEPKPLRGVTETISVEAR
jgi:hypothetical protein